MSIFIDSGISVSSGSVLIDWCFSLVLVIFSCFFTCLVPGSVWLDARHCQFYLEHHIFLCYFKSSWALFWDAVKLLGNSLIHLGLAFMIGALLSLGLIIYHFWVLCLMQHELWGFFSLTSRNRQYSWLYVSTRRCSVSVFQMVLSPASGSFLSHVPIRTLPLQILEFCL